MRDFLGYHNKKNLEQLAVRQRFRESCKILRQKVAFDPERLH